MTTVYDPKYNNQNKEQTNETNERKNGPKRIAILFSG